MTWRCTLTPKNTIRIEHYDTEIGKYYLMEKPFCTKCTLPLNPNFPHCALCGNIKHFKIARCVGLYFKVHYQGNLTYIKRREDDLLTKHLLALKSNKEFAKPIGLAMVLCFKHVYRELATVDIITPVPQHQDSLTQRGYNQTEEMARVISSRINVPLDTTLLVKTKDIKMVGKNRFEREELVKELYVATKNLNGESVLLIDDILTTGYSVDECARVLKNAGAGEVRVYVAGRDAPEY